MKARNLALWTLALALGAVAPSPTLAREPLAPPEVQILTPRGGQTAARLVEITGTVKNVSSKRLTLVLNGVALSIRREDEAFKSTQVLAPGWNAIRVVATNAVGRAQDAVALYARVPRKDLRVALTWDTPGNDVDLWVTGPDGEKIFFSHKQGKAGGTLDVDVTTGYGPETYTQARAVPGTYRVQAHYFSGAVPTRVAVTIVEREGTPTEARRIFRGILALAGEVLEVGEFTLD